MKGEGEKSWVELADIDGSITAHNKHTERPRGVSSRIKISKWTVLPKFCPQERGWEQGFQTLFQRIFDVQSFEWESEDCF